MSRTVCVIPARYHSTRFPQKVLASIEDKPMLQWVWESAKATGRFDAIHFAVDHEETAELVASFGATSTMTCPGCLTGTARLIDFANRSQEAADIWVNWQADEPFITKPMIDALLKKVPAISTLRKKVTNEAIDDPNIVKVVTDKRGNALYFSRAAIPYFRSKEVPVYKHFGIYAFTDKALRKIAEMPPCDLEEAEMLEQLRFIYHGLTIRVAETAHDTVGIDTLQDLARAKGFVQQAQYT